MSEARLRESNGILRQTNADLKRDLEVEKRNVANLNREKVRDCEFWGPICFAVQIDGKGKIKALV